MKYRRLPIETKLEQISDDTERQRVREVLFHDTANTEGFQMVTLLLRALEQRAMFALRNGAPEALVGRILGRLECITEIRESLTRLLPEEIRPAVDWAAEEQEGFVNVDDGLPAGEEVE